MFRNQTGAKLAVISLMGLGGVLTLAWVSFLGWCALRLGGLV
jgi:hypothetical protein